MASHYDLTVECNTTFNASFIILTGLDGTPFDLTGYSVRACAQSDYDADSIAFEFVVDLIAPANGKFSLYLSPIQTVIIEPGTYVYDVVATLEGDKYRLIEGRVNATPGVTD
jgi:hypothetical protein